MREEGREEGEWGKGGRRGRESWKGAGEGGRGKREREEGREGEGEGKKWKGGKRKGGGEGGRERECYFFVYYVTAEDHHCTYPQHIHLTYCCDEDT